ncbi:MAG: membrane protein insertion efficiency factor YidD [Cytophagales bacterium]|nr:membrane protein insertion efficiency factor YidD [Cytophagales bacterium]
MFLQTIWSKQYYYKYFISSQDLTGICNFHPSCSEYGILSIKICKTFVCFTKAPVSFQGIRTTCLFLSTC